VESRESLEKIDIVLNSSKENKRSMEKEAIHHIDQGLRIASHISDNQISLLRLIADLPALGEEFDD